MKHHDSVQQASNKLALSLETLSDWRLPATPINYAVAYEYIVGKNAALNKAIDHHIKANGKPDNFIIEQLYIDHVVGQNNFRVDIVEDVDELLSEIQKDCMQTSMATQNVVDSMDEDIACIESGTPDEMKMAALRLRKASKTLRQQQHKFAEQIISSQQKTSSLKKELDEAKKELYFDAITGLYNKKALSKHFDAWIVDNPNQKIGALVIDIDHFSQFSEKFGSLIGDVILSKIAGKINRYVDDSGLPVRTGNHEFFILLPDVEQSITSEIAEKIRQGVEKIRFISSKSGMRLPQMTISLGVTEYKLNESLESLITRSKTALKQAQLTGRNTVAVA
ncbi:GGDEF domain-containing protein [Thalassotalea atypica]|uniref:GGDEF domain-containing protein n=1 Tax=Thalassotalea atypica TaxID=2054316 RepID=UPI0025737A1A|nr:GGDEF domain-containing protein [Thalassotalea atypica]